METSERLLLVVGAALGFTASAAESRGRDGLSVDWKNGPVALARMVVSRS